MNSTRNDLTPIGIAVLRPIEPQSDSRRFQVYFSATKWSSIEEAIGWAAERNIDRRFVLNVWNRAILGHDIQVEAAEPGKPHLLVFEDGEKRQVIGHFESRAHCDCWAVAYFGKLRVSKTLSYEIFDPDTQDPNLEKMNLSEDYSPPNRGRSFP